jgi:hypothetical protein
MRGTALKVSLLVAVGSLALASSPALADVCLTVEGVTQNLTTGTRGSDCSPSGERKVFLDAQTNSATGNGQVGSQTGMPTVDFSSTWPVGTTSFLDFANGFSTIDPNAKGKDASFPNLTIDIPTAVAGVDVPFTDILFGLQMVKLGTESLTVTAMDGSTVEGVWDLSGISHDKDDKFAIIASNMQAFTDIILTAGSDSGIKEVKQVQLSGISGVVPESSTWAMMLVGFAGLGFAGYRKTKGARTAVSI